MINIPHGLVLNITYYEYLATLSQLHELYSAYGRVTKNDLLENVKPVQLELVIFSQHVSGGTEETNENLRMIGLGDTN
jgi:hypothetical protein